MTSTHLQGNPPGSRPQMWSGWLLRTVTPSIAENGRSSRGPMVHYDGSTVTMDKEKPRRTETRQFSVRVWLCLHLPYLEGLSAKARAFSLSGSFPAFSNQARQGRWGGRDGVHACGMNSGEFQGIPGKRFTDILCPKTGIAR